MSPSDFKCEKNTKGGAENGAVVMQRSVRPPPWEGSGFTSRDLPAGCTYNYDVRLAEE